MKKLPLFFLFAMVFLVPRHQASAAITEPVITYVAADLETMILTIRGMNLPTNARVYMGRAEGGVWRLATLDATRDRITARIASRDAGTFLVCLFISSNEYYTTTVAIEEIENAVPDETIPVGTVVSWWRPDDTWPVPNGYAICDGSVLNDPASPLHGTNLPDLRYRYVKGAFDPTTIGGRSGSNLHEHSVNLAHTHSSSTSSYAGVHGHAWLQWWGGTATQFNTWNNSGTSLLATAWDNGIDGAGSGIYPLAIMSPSSNQTWYTERGGSHSHSVAAPPLGDLFRVSSSGSSAPPTVSLLMIMRVR